MSRTRHPRRPRGTGHDDCGHRYRDHGRWFRKHVMWDPDRRARPGERAALVTAIEPYSDE